MRPISLVYCTHRKTPHWNWWVDAICNQADFDQRRHLNVIFVDGQLWDSKMPLGAMQTIGPSLRLADPLFHDQDRRLELELIVNNRLDYTHIPPMPSVYSGPFRLTKKDWFDASNTRNTGFVAAVYPYVGFCDDLSVPGRQWLDQLLHAAEHDYTVAGMYKKVKKLIVENGVRMSHEEFPGGVDSRWEHGSPEGIVEWTGSIYGCSFGVPLDAALTVDGFEMACSGSGGEDYDFGIRLNRSGQKVYLNQNLFTFESEEGHHSENFMDLKLRERREVIRANLPVAYDSYSLCNDAEKYMSDHVLLNRVRNEARITPLLPQNLRALREQYQATGLVPVPTQPTLDWRDNVPLCSL